MALQPSMLGKRIRGNTPADIQQVKRPLTALVGPTSTKPSLGNTPAKRVAAGPPVMQRTLSQKENQAVQPIVAPEQDDVFMATPSEDKPSAGAYTLSPPPCLPRSDIADAVPQPSANRTVPHVYAHAASLLSTSSDLAASLPLSGRTDQRETLLAFLQRRFPAAYAAPEGSSSTPPRPGPAAMYVSGPPGIGKTALLSSVLSDFTRQVDERDLRDEIPILMENCATLAAGGLGGDKAWEKLTASFGLRPNDLLILDEIDHLVTPSSSTRSPASQQPDLLNALFQLASVPASPLTLIGIANDLTLKALSLTPPATPLATDKGKAKADPLSTPTKPIRLHFKPYSWQELVHIVDQRLSLLDGSYPIDLDLNVAPAPEASSPLSAGSEKPAKKTSFPLVDKPALERCAKKIAAGTGDVRTMLDVVRRAVASVGHEQAALPEVNLASFARMTAPKASMKHVSAALAASSGLSVAPTLASRLSALQSGPHQRLVLVSIIIALSRLDTDGAGLAHVSSTSHPIGGIAPRVVVDECYKVYRDFVSSEDILKASALDSSTFVETVGMIEDLGGFVTVRGRPGSSPSSSPSKSGGGAVRRLTPTKAKKHERGRVTVELAPSSPLHDLLAVMTAAPSPGRESDEDEIARIARRLLERERSAQRWNVKRRAMGRDEDRRAEEELEGREWERSLQAAEAEGPSASKGGA
ncbi:AAA ATPase [Rhodotorula sphaerocarpa]